jgi:hypothetical protein
MKNAVLTLLAVLAFASASASAGCSSETEEEPPAAEESSALRNTGGGTTGDPDECMASRMGCYQSCAKSGAASCYRYCDMVYAKCRGLPSPESMMR